MKRQRLKLKKASAVLQMRPKELQNLVQFGVVKPSFLDGIQVPIYSTSGPGRIILSGS